MKDQIVEIVRKYAGSMADAILDPSCQYFSTPNVEGIIGYRQELDSMVVFGDPVCASQDIPVLTKAFHEFCESKGKSVVYISASESFAKWAIQNVCHTMIEAGKECYINPQNDPRAQTGTHASLVRRKVKHAQKEDVVVLEYLKSDVMVQGAIEEVGKEWLHSRKGPQIYISHVHLFDNPKGKRWFYAKKNNEVVGVVLLNQLQSRNGWHLNHLMITPEAPHGTSELLVVSALDTVRNEGCHYVTFGTVPSKHLGKMEGMGKLSAWVTKFLFQCTRMIFHLDGHLSFWEKFHPEHLPVYILFSQSKVKIREMVGLMKAMNISV